MISPWFVYLIFMLDSIRLLFAFLGAFMLTRGMLITIDKLEGNKKIIFILSFIFFSISFFTPKTKQVVAIYVIPKLSQYIHENKIDEKALEEYDFLINKINKEYSK